MSSTLCFCKKCELAFNPDEISQNLGISLGEFHKSHATIVEYDPKIHDKPEPILGKCVEKDGVSGDDFKASMKAQRFYMHRDAAGNTAQVLDKDIKYLRPLSIEDDTKFILTYLPTQIFNDKGTRVARENRAYFFSKDSNGYKYLTLADDPKLTDEYEINVSQSEIPRWSRSDVNDYFNTDKLIDAKKVYEDSINSIREYFEYQDDESYDMVALWNIGTYFYELFNTFPYLDFDATKGSGKTKNLDYQRQVCFNAIKSSNITGSSQFRIIEQTGATVLYDETENLNNTKSEKAQDTLQILHSGFMKGDSAYRTEGSSGKYQQKRYSVYGPKCLAHINTIGDVTEDRCIQIPLLRSTNKSILDKDVDYLDPHLQKIRDSYYRLYLDYADEILGLVAESRALLDVSGRELRLWTPLITLALFFEKHGVKGITAKIKAKCHSIHENRVGNDEEHSPEGKILRFIHDRIRGKSQEDGIKFTDVFREFEQYATQYGFTESFRPTQKYFAQKLRQLGFQKLPRKPDGWHYDISDEKINAALARFNIPYQTTLEDKDVK